MVWRLRRHDALAAPQVVVALVACAYGAGVVANTLLPIYLAVPGPEPSWRVFINLTPMANTEATDMLQNVVLFLPLGFLIPLLTRVRSALWVLARGFLIILAMEALQFVGAAIWHSGHIADINDLVTATIGMAVGYGCFRGISGRRAQKLAATST